MIHKPTDGDYERAERIVRRLREAGHEALLAGGCVRDLLMERRPSDYDVATSARPEQVEGLFPHTSTVGRQFGVCPVIVDGRSYQVATFRQDSAHGPNRSRMPNTRASR